MKLIKTVPAIVTLALTGAMTVGVGAPAHAGKGKPTHFGLAASGFGTRVNGGDVPASSDTTAYQAIGCTNRAGKVRENHVANVTLPGAGTASDITSKMWTDTGKRNVVTHSRAAVAEVVLGDPSTGTVEIRGVVAKAKAAHGRNGFTSRTNTKIASLTWVDPTGTEQELDVPAPGEPVVVPGVGTIYLGKSKKSANGHMAHAIANGLVVKMALSGTKVKIAHADAEINDDVKSGVFGGRSSAVQSTAVQDILSVGAQPLSLMPCQGTRGEVRDKSIAQLEIGPNITLRELTSQLQSDQTRRKAEGYDRGRVGAIDINDGQVIAKNVVGRAWSKLNNNGLHRSTEGTDVGTVMVEGEEQEFPDSDTIEIPGVVKLERNVIKKRKHGIQVTALRITLLDGSGAVINLGQAKMVIRDAGF